jgi:hypothetical protein
MLAAAVAGTVAVAQPPTEFHFPTLSSTTLAGRKVTLPHDFGGRPTLVLVAFKREHQRLVDTWLPAAGRLATAHAGFHYYELPTLGRGLTLMRPMIDGRMRRGIPDAGACGPLTRHAAARAGRTHTRGAASCRPPRVVSTSRRSGRQRVAPAVAPVSDRMSVTSS